MTAAAVVIMSMIRGKEAQSNSSYPIGKKKNKKINNNSC